MEELIRAPQWTVHCARDGHGGFAGVAAVVDRNFPEGSRCVPPNGGFFCWVTLPEGLSADELFPQAAGAGIAYVKGSDCVIEGGERTLRLAYSGVSPAEIAEGMERLGAVFRGAPATA